MKKETERDSIKIHRSFKMSQIQNVIVSMLARWQKQRTQQCQQQFVSKQDREQKKGRENSILGLFWVC